MKMTSLKVSDVDPYMDAYKVVIGDRVIGEKSRPFGYLKAPYNKNGNMISVKDRKYKGTPPWMNYEVVKIGYLEIVVKKEED